VSAKIICLGCAVLERDRSENPFFRYPWALRCVCGGVKPEQYRAMRVRMHELAERAESIPLT